MRLAELGLPLAAIGVVALAVSGPGTRFGLLPWQLGLGLFAFAGLAGVAVAIIAARARLWPLVAVGAAVAALPVAALVQALSVPRINDVSAELQISGAPGEAHAKALEAARSMGWEIVKSDPKAGRIEAVATTFWFGFKDDLEVRIHPAGRDSRVAVRSKSRVGRGDSGTNASRIRAFFERLK